MLRLGEQWVAFEASSTLSDIFYDDVNQKICTVRGNGALGVTAKGLSSRDIVSFRMKDTGKIKVMKFSPDRRLASVQCEDSSVDFVCVSPNGEATTCAYFSQPAKMRSARIIGLEWVTNNQILFVTNQGIEVYQVNVEKRISKLLKTCNVSLFWFMYYPKSNLLVVSSGANGAILNPFVIQNGIIHRLPKFEVDFGCSNAKTNLIERDVTIASVYGILYVMVLRHSRRDSSTSDVAMYKLSGNASEETTLTHTLLLGRTGAFAIHVIDNVIIVHHQTSGMSIVFDIGLKERSQIGVTVHKPLLIVPLERSDKLSREYHGEIPLYSPSWVIFPPNFIVDASIGIFSTVSLYPEKGESAIEDKCTYLRFLFNRCSVKTDFLEKFKDLLISNMLTLKQVSMIFSWIIEPFKLTPSSRIPENGSKFTLIADEYEQTRIEQSDVISSVLLPANECSSIDKQMLVQCMLQYLLTLQENKLDVLPYFLNEILVPAMVSAGELNRLQQLLQYRVIPDAKQLAFSLLSHEAKHAPLIQLAVDMLARLGSAAEEIVEVLLSRGNVTDAIRFLETTGSVERVNSMKLLESAWTQNRQIRFAIFSYFNDRAMKSRYNNFVNSEQYEDYLRRFKALFTNEEVEEARRDSQRGTFLNDCDVKL